MAALVHFSLATLVFRSQQKQCTQIHSRAEDRFCISLQRENVDFSKDQTAR